MVRDDSDVKPTMSANSTDDRVEPIDDQALAGLQAIGDRRGQHVEQQALRRLLLVGELLRALLDEALEVLVVILDRLGHRVEVLAELADLVARQRPACAR